MAVALTLEYLFLWFLLYAFIGWVYESVLVSVSERRWVNRGFLNGPLCPIYGCGAVLAIVLLHDFTNPIEIFLISSFGASILEYITSWGMEKLFHARWWDYSHYRFNIQGRICLLGAIVFGFGGVLIIDVVQPQVERLTAMIPLLAVHVICAVAAIVAGTCRQYASACLFRVELAATSYDPLLPTHAFHGLHQIQQDHGNRA